MCDRNFTRVGDIIFLLGQQDENISDCVVFIYIYIYVNWTILCIQLDVNKVISCCINMLILLDWKRKTLPNMQFLMTLRLQHELN